MDIRAVIILCLEALLAFWLLRRAGMLRRKADWYLSALLIAAAFFLRYLCLDYVTLDYKDFLSRWVSFYREHGGFDAFSYPLGNYNIPYMYFLCLFSYSDISDLYLIKLLSIFFDVLLAYGSMMLLSKAKDSNGLCLACFFTVLFLPTVILNGSLWAQCDSIYVALAILALYCALDDRPVVSVLLFTLSFGFKLQAVFVMPIMAVLWFKGKYRLWHFLLFPLFYVLLVLPAVLLGKPFLDTVTLYFSQTGSIGSGMNYNSPSVFAMLRGLKDEALASKLAIAAAFLWMLLILVFCYVNRSRLDNTALILAAVLLAVGIPFLLPHMHDRYFFAADILTVVLAYSCGACFAVAPLTQFASLLGYHAYLKMRYLLYMDHGSRALIGVLLISVSALVYKVYRASPDDGDFAETKI